MDLFKDFRFLYRKTAPAIASETVFVVFDKSIPQDVLNIHLNTINAVRTVYDIDIIGYNITNEAVGVDFFSDTSGISTGNVKNLETIKEASIDLINKGAVFAIFWRFFNKLRAAKM